MNTITRELTPAQIRLVAIAKLTAQDSCDLDEWEEEMIENGDADLTTTRDTFNDWTDASFGWEEARGSSLFTVEGHNCVAWESMQAVKGQTRTSLVVVDFGEFTACYKF